MKYQPRSFLDLMISDEKEEKNIPIIADIKYTITKMKVNVCPNAILYLLDYTDAAYEVVGPGSKTFLGYNSSDLKEAGPLAYFDCWHKEDWHIYNTEIFTDHFKILNSIPIHERQFLLFKTNYRIRGKYGNFLAIAQQCSYLDILPNGMPGIVGGLVTDITPYKQDDRIIYTITYNNPITKQTIILHNKIYFPGQRIEKLTQREKEILKYISEGLGSKQIADKLHVSIHTVNNHRSNMLMKTGCNNIAELLKKHGRDLLS